MRILAFLRNLTRRRKVEQDLADEVSSYVAIGLAASVGLTRVLQSLLFGVTATDVVTFLGVSVLLGAVALLATYIPARKAARVDPMIALQCE
jgi:putative ABC transport system permease protein